MFHFLKKYKSPTNMEFPTESCQLCLEVGIFVCFFSTLTCDQSIEQGYEIVKKIKVDQDGNDLKSVQGFAVDVLRRESHVTRW